MERERSDEPLVILTDVGRVEPDGPDELATTIEAIIPVVGEFACGRFKRYGMATPGRCSASGTTRLPARCRATGRSGATCCRSGPGAGTRPTPSSTQLDARFERLDAPARCSGGSGAVGCVAVEERGGESGVEGYGWRRRAGIPDDAVLVVRGDDLDPGTSRDQAVSFLRRFPDWGRYGLSAYYARDDAEVDDLAADQLERFPVLAVFELTALVEAGFDLVPTFRTPHVTVAFSADLERHLLALAKLHPRVVENPYHDREPGE